MSTYYLILLVVERVYIPRSEVPATVTASKSRWPSTVLLAAGITVPQSPFRLHYHVFNRCSPYPGSPRRKECGELSLGSLMGYEHASLLSTIRQPGFNKEKAMI